MRNLSGQQVDASPSVDDVREFYDLLPYPAPLKDLDQYRKLWLNRDRSRWLFSLFWPCKSFREDQDILVAGCGTSQAAKHALREPKARVTAIDISETSLQHTRSLKEKYHLDNLELHQIPIEEVEGLGRSFDKIVCTGAIHHLPDPGIGLRALRGVLKPEGAVHIMVYAPYGRTGIYMLQDYCRILGVSTSPADLKELETTLSLLPQDHPLAPLLGQAKDLQDPVELADALLHPLDRAYTVPQLYELLQRCGLFFGRWFEQAPYLPYCGRLAGTPHYARLAALPAHSQHASAELFRGNMTRHTFIAYRDDRDEVSQPIQFDDDQWRGYVPLRVPWGVAVRDGRVPKGAAAVLINPAHTFTDLLLPMSHEEDA
ncbi:MAG: class I SAM-dependent methyltransferase, partial [Stenotrophomonas maltophilia]